MKLSKIALIWKVLAACIAGVLLGLVLPSAVVRIFTTFTAIFSQYIGFVVPLIIVGLVTPAICRVGSGAGRMLLITLAIAYCSTVVAGIFSYTLSSNLFPYIVGGSMLDAQAGSAMDASPYFTIEIPPLMGIMTALVFSFVVGIMVSATDGNNLRNIIYDFEKVVHRAITKTVIPLLPLYVFGIFLKLSFTGEAVPMLVVFAKVILVILAMSLVWLVLMFLVAWAISGKKPFRSLFCMLPAYLTALGTSSSAATIPVTMERARKCGVSEPVAGFVIPLCATIHLPGSVIKITACALTIMLVQGQAFDFGMFLGFIALLSITAVAAPGVPGGMIMASLGVLSSVLGFGEANQALMIALYVVMDSFGTACNVTGDGAIALIVDKIAR